MDATPDYACSAMAGVRSNLLMAVSICHVANLTSLHCNQMLCSVSRHVDTLCHAAITALLCVMRWAWFTVNPHYSES